MRRGDMEQIHEDEVEMAIAKSLLLFAALAAAFCIGVACGYLIWGD